MKIHKTEIPKRLNIKYEYIKDLDLKNYYDIHKISNNEFQSYLLKYKLIKINKFIYSNKDNSIILIIPFSTILVDSKKNNFKLLKEDNRKELIKRSRKQNDDRYNRRTTIDDSEIRYGMIDLNKFFSHRHIISFEIFVRDYTVTIEVPGLIQELKKNVKRQNYDLIRKYLTKAFDNNDIYVNCTCPDFWYRYSYTASVRGFKSGKMQQIPSPIRNPNLEGSVCKHLLKLLNNKRWLRKYVTLINLLVKMNPQVLQ